MFHLRIKHLHLKEYIFWILYMYIFVSCLPGRLFCTLAVEPCLHPNCTCNWTLNCDMKNISFFGLLVCESFLKPFFCCCNLWYITLLMRMFVFFLHRIIGGVKQKNLQVISVFDTCCCKSCYGPKMFSFLCDVLVTGNPKYSSVVTVPNCFYLSNEIHIIKCFSLFFTNWCVYCVWLCVHLYECVCIFMYRMFVRCFKKIPIQQFFYENNIVSRT